MIYATHEIMKLRNSECAIGYISRISGKRITNSIEYIYFWKMADKFGSKRSNNTL